MNNNLDDLLDNDQSESIQLPQMLNVLTILTFIGSGFSLLTNIWSFTTLAQTQETFELSRAMQSDMGEELDNPFANNIMEGTIIMLENGPTLYTVGIIVCILGIIGALQMRKLKKTGFFIYSTANFLGIVIPLAIVGLGLMGSIILASSIFTILFIILYAVNLKHLQ